MNIKKKFSEINNDKNMNKFWVKFLSIFFAITVSHKITKLYLIDNIIIESAFVVFLILIFILIFGNLDKLLSKNM